MKLPVFVVSLDFELHWGGFEKWSIETHRSYFLNTRQVIPLLLDLFLNNEIHATWATVGMLFHENENSLVQCFPVLKPTYDEKKLSPYEFIQQHGIGNTEAEDPFHFAFSLLRRIEETQFQEVGSHTFAHFYCNEPGQTLAQFRADLRAAQKSALIHGKNLKSLVFPRNQFNEEYLRVCYEEGFISVRDNPGDWFWNINSTQRESTWKRLNRGMDAYLPIGKKNTYAMESLQWRPGLPVCIPASRLLRPYRPEELFLNKIKISRIKNEMERAAKEAEVYHLWWHPHNFGHHPKESMDGLREILDHFSMCKEKYGMQSLSMGEIAEIVMNGVKD